MKKILISLIAVVGLALSGCAASEDTSPNNSSITQVIDVRTSAEYLSGHVAGAINIDVESSGFASEILTLDKAGVYLVYCHSGRRSAIAAGMLNDAGYTVLDGGGIDSMLANGWELGQ